MIRVQVGIHKKLSSTDCGYILVLNDSRVSYEFLASAVSSCLDDVINFLFSNKFILAKKRRNGATQKSKVQKTSL